MIEREVIEETFFDDFIIYVCGVETFTTQTEVNIVKTFPDGSQTVHRRVQFVPDHRRNCQREMRWALRRSGSSASAIRLNRHGEGTIFSVTGARVQVREDGPL